MTLNTDRELGRLSAEVENLKEDTQETKEVVKDLQKDIKEIHAILNRAQGQWKALVIFGTFCSVLGGLMVKGLAYFKGWNI